MGKLCLRRGAGYAVVIHSIEETIKEKPKGIHGGLSYDGDELKAIYENYFVSFIVEFELVIKSFDDNSLDDILNESEKSMIERTLTEKGGTQSFFFKKDLLNVDTYFLQDDLWVNRSGLKYTFCNLSKNISFTVTIPTAKQEFFEASRNNEEFKKMGENALEGNYFCSTFNRKLPCTYSRGGSFTFSFFELCKCVYRHEKKVSYRDDYETKAILAKEVKTAREKASEQKKWDNAYNIILNQVNLMSGEKQQTFLSMLAEINSAAIERIKS